MANISAESWLSKLLTQEKQQEEKTSKPDTPTKSLTHKEFKNKYDNGEREFKNYRLGNIDLKKINLYGVSFENCTFQLIDLRDVSLRDANLKQANFDGNETERY